MDSVASPKPSSLPGKGAGATENLPVVPGTRGEHHPQGEELALQGCSELWALPGASASECQEARDNTANRSQGNCIMIYHKMLRNPPLEQPLLNLSLSWV